MFCFNPRPDEEELELLLETEDEEIIDNELEGL